MVARSSGPMDRAFGFDLGAEVLRTLRRDVVHGHAFAREWGEIAVELHRIHDDDFFDLRLGKNRQDLVQLLVRRQKNGPAAGVIQDECGLFGRERGVERNGYGPEQQAGHIGDGPLGAVLAEDGDAISGSNAPGMQRVRGSGDALAELAGRDRQPLPGIAIQHDAVQVAFDRGEENIVQSGNAHCVFRAQSGLVPRAVATGSEQNFTVL